MERAKKPGDYIYEEHCHGRERNPSPEVIELLEKAECPGYGWLLYAEHTVKIEETDRHMIGPFDLEVQYDPQDPVKSFLENVAGFCDLLFADFQLSLLDTPPDGDAEEKSRAEAAHQVFVALCEAAATLGHPVPGKRVTITDQNVLRSFDSLSCGLLRLSGIKAAHYKKADNVIIGGRRFALPVVKILDQERWRHFNDEYKKLEYERTDWAASGFPE